MTLNWRRGLLGLWLVETVLWLVGVGAVFQVHTAVPAYWELRDTPQRFEGDKTTLSTVADRVRRRIIEFKIKDGESLTPEEQAFVRRKEALRRLDVAKGRLLFFAGAGIVPPVLVLALGAVLAWAFRGFKWGALKRWLRRRGRF